MQELTTDVLRLNVRRTYKGLHLRIWADPQVELFFRQLALDRQRAITGTTWKPNDPNKILYAWDPLENPWVGGTVYTLMALDQPLAVEDAGEILTNLSFLRLVGVSDEPGLDLAVRQVVTAGQLATAVAKPLERSLVRFYEDYLREANVQIRLVTKMRS